MIVVSHNQSSESSKPCEGALDYIASPVSIQESEVLSIDVSIILSMRRQKVYASFSELFSMRVAVISLVSDHSLGSGFGSAWSFLEDPVVRHDVFEERELSGRYRVGMAPRRHTLAIDYHHVVRSLASFGFSDRRAPFFAGTKVASTRASSQSSMWLASHSARRTRHMFVMTPASCQFIRRRQHVEPSGNSTGRSRHVAPVLRIQRMPSMQARSSAGGRPPSGLGGRAGINGLIYSHYSSVNIGFRIPIGSPPISLLRENREK